MPEGGEVALTIDYNYETGKADAVGYAIVEEKGFTKKGVRNAYVAEAMNYSKVEDNDRAKVEGFILGSYWRKAEKPEKKSINGPTVSVYGKYKPVALKVKPVYTELPEEYRIKRDIRGDPLAELPRLQGGIRKKEKTVSTKYTLETFCCQKSGS